MTEINYEEQTKITRAIIKSAVLMLEFGAESILVEQTAERLGKALGVGIHSSRSPISKLEVK